MDRPVQHVQEPHGVYFIPFSSPTSPNPRISHPIRRFFSACISNRIKDYMQRPMDGNYRRVADSINIYVCINPKEQDGERYSGVFWVIDWLDNIDKSDSLHPWLTPLPPPGSTRPQIQGLCHLAHLSAVLVDQLLLVGFLISLIWSNLIGAKLKWICYCLPYYPPTLS